MRHLLLSMFLALTVIVLAIMAAGDGDKQFTGVEEKVVENYDEPEEDNEKMDENTYENRIASSGFRRP